MENLSLWLATYLLTHFIWMQSTNPKAVELTFHSTQIIFHKFLFFWYFLLLQCGLLYYVLLHCLKWILAILYDWHNYFTKIYTAIKSMFYFLDWIDSLYADRRVKEGAWFFFLPNQLHYHAHVPGPFKITMKSLSVIKRWL